MQDHRHRDDVRRRKRRVPVAEKVELLDGDARLEARRAHRRLGGAPQRGQVGARGAQVRVRRRDGARERRRGAADIAQRLVARPVELAGERRERGPVGAAHADREAQRRVGVGGAAEGRQDVAHEAARRRRLRAGAQRVL